MRLGMVAANARGDAVMACSARTIIFNMALSTSATFMGVKVSPEPARVIICVVRMNRGNAE